MEKVFLLIGLCVLLVGCQQEYNESYPVCENEEVNKTYNIKDYDCEDIYNMIELDYYPSVIEEYEIRNCEGKIVGRGKRVFESPKGFKQKYFEECIINKKKIN